MKAKFVLWSGITLLTLLIISACGGSKEEKTASLKGKAVTAETVSVGKYQVQDFRSFPGTVEARNEIILSSKVSGYVTKMAVQEGDQVAKGDLLLRIDDREIRERILALKQARQALIKEKEALSARLAYAQSNFERFQRLFREEAATKEEFERAQAEYLSLRSQVEALKRRERETLSQIKAIEALLPYTRITAPTEGIVARRLVDEGSFVNMGQPLLYLDDLKAGFWLVAEVDESLLSKVSEGQDITVSIPHLGKTFQAPVEVVVDHVSPQTRTFRLKVTLPSLGLKAGLFGRVFIPLETRESLLIPWKAVVRRGALTAVYVVGNDQIIRLRLIKTGHTYIQTEGGFLPSPVPAEASHMREGLFVEVLSGLNPGEVILQGDLDHIQEGDILAGR
ncbi:efflux RND transporter periplasmic adaptor subunit [Thermosulfuriphilus sp.]